MNRMSTSTCNMTPLFENHYIFKRLHWRLKGKNSKLLNAKIWKDHFIAKQISNLVRNKMYQIFYFFLICLSCQISTFITFTSTNITFDQQFANLRTQEGSLQAQKKQWLTWLFFLLYYTFYLQLLNKLQLFFQYIYLCTICAIIFVNTFYLLFFKKM